MCACCLYSKISETFYVQHIKSELERKNMSVSELKGKLNRLKDEFDLKINGEILMVKWQTY